MKSHKKEKERKAFKNKDIYNKNNNISIHHTRTRMPMCVRTRGTPHDVLRYCGIRFKLTTRATSSPSHHPFAASTTASFARYRVVTVVTGRHIATQQQVAATRERAPPRRICHFGTRCSSANVCNGSSDALKCSKRGSGKVAKVVRVYLCGRSASF